MKFLIMFGNFYSLAHIPKILHSQKALHVNIGILVFCFKMTKDIKKHPQCHCPQPQNVQPIILFSSFASMTG